MADDDITWDAPKDDITWDAPHPAEAADHGLSERQKLSPVGKAMSPITSYPETYRHMNQESRDQMSRGLEQITHPESLIDPQAHGISDVLSGIGNVAAGGMNYVTSPIMAGVRSLATQPLEDVTGIPREYPEFAAQLASPYLGFGKVPGRPAVAPASPAPGPLGVTLSEGQATHSLPAIRTEQAALREQLGPQAAEHAEAFRTQQAGQVDAAAENVARGLDPNGQQILGSSPQAAAEMAGSTVRSEAARAKAGVKAKYDYAKDQPGEIDSSVFNGIGDRIKNDLSGGDNPVIIDDKLTPHASAALNDIEQHISRLRIPNKAEVSPPNPEDIVGVNLRGVDQVRKRLSEYRRAAYGSGNASDGRAAQAVLDAFDARVTDAVNNGMFNGDPMAVNAWNDARAAHADYMGTFGKGKNDPVGRVVQKVLGDRVNDPATPNAIADHLYGASGINPSDLNLGVAKRFKKILGADSPEWAAVRQGLLQRLVETGEGVTDFGSGRIAQRLNKFLNVDGREMSEVIFTPQQREMLQQYADLHRALEVPKTGANFSETSTFVAPMLKRVMGGLSALVGGVLGHAVAPGMHGVGEVAGAMIANRGTEALSNARNARKISSQMPLLAKQMAEWKRAMAAQKAGPSSKAITARSAAAWSQVTRSLDKIGFNPSMLREVQGPVPSAAQGNQDKGSGWGNAEPDQGAGNKAHGGSIMRARGGSFKASGGAVERAIRASKGYAEGGAPELSDDDQAAMMPETFANPYLKQTLARSLEASPPRDENVRFRTASPLVNITDEDIDRGVNIGMASGPGSIKGVAPGIRAYHGSPHDFDKFDLSKIGTGEGAQAYGHGLYFADNEGVAKSYRDALSNGFVAQDGAPLTGSVRDAAKYIKEHGSIPNALRDLEERSASYKSAHGGDWSPYDESLSTLKTLDPSSIKGSGKMYEVNINADPSHFLDWDKPLSQQSQKIQEAFKDVPQAPEIPGQLAYYRMAGRKLQSPETSAKLAEAGIPGIKYLDQGSRAHWSNDAYVTKPDAQGLYSINGGGISDKFSSKEAAQAALDKVIGSAPPVTSNYVVFNHDLINIVRKYALAGIALPPAIAAEYEKMQQNGRATGGAVSRAVRASKGYETGGAPDYDPFAAETFLPPELAGLSARTAQNDVGRLRDLTSMEPSDRSGENVRFKTASPMVNITDEDIDRGMNVAMASGPGKIEKPGVGLIKRSTEIPNIRELPAAEAIKVARTEPHLIKAGDQSEGHYVGGPRDIQSKRGLTNLRNRFDDYVAADPRGGDWYDRYRNSIADVTGNDPLQNKWMSNQEGQWSAGVSPEGELGFALKENNASLAGMPVKSARPAQHIAHERAIEAQDPARYQLGDKTGEYASLINPDRPKPPGATGVNDFRHARNFDYTEAAGGSQRDALTAAQHKFLDYETALAVDRANKADLGGRSNWTGEQLQAAPWVRQKALDLMSRNEKLSYDEAFARANTTIGDFFDKHTAFATHEAMPGADTGHLSGSIGAPSAEREAFAADPRSTWATAPGGRDAIYGGMGIEGTGNAMRVRPTTEMQGLYTPPGGATEANPGWTARPLVAFDAGKAKTVAPADQTLLNAGEATRGYIDAQNASAWHKPWAGGAPGESNSLFMPMEGKATPEQLTALQKATAPHGLPDIADTGKGITATSFWPPPGDIGKALKTKGGLLDAIRGVLPGAEPKRVKVDSNLIDYVPKWQEGVGSGAATRELLEHITKTPRLKAAMTNNPNIAKAAIDRLERDQEWASKWGAPREDIQNARRIIGGGTGWVERLETALKKGALLPAAAIAVFGTAALQEHGRS